MQRETKMILKNFAASLMNGKIPARNYAENAVNCNNSDFDLCDYNGKTIITYSWGNQLGKEFLALAEYHGNSREFLQSFFE